MTTRPRALRRRTITAVALAALTSGLAAAPAATATAMPRTVTAHDSSHDSTGTRDPAAVRALLAALPDGVTDAALVRVAGRGNAARSRGRPDRWRRTPGSRWAA
ncbi:hypothetical protein ACFWMU_36465 [Streptomyces sp. NPDC058357]|uniref:hypothetical protein n=1 Tax=unclassified Streptomyces TaxID=2593676 RepID=UPI00364BB5A3